MTQRREEAEAAIVEGRQRLEELKDLLASQEEGLSKALDRLKIQEKEQESRRIRILAGKAKALKKAKRFVEKVSGARIQTSAAILLQVSEWVMKETCGRAVCCLDA